MAANKFVMEVLSDGKISVESVGGFAGTVHKDADELLRDMQKLAGGAFTVRKKVQKPNERKIETHHTT